MFILSPTEDIFYAGKQSAVQYSMKPCTHDQVFLETFFVDKFNMLVCTKKIDQFSLAPFTRKNCQGKFARVDGAQELVD